MGRSLDVEDPLTAAIAPPLNESPHDRALREEREAQAKKTSDEIDEMLRTERVALRKRRKPVKVLLLGQSESGKSTTLKSEFKSPLPSTPRKQKAMRDKAPRAPGASLCSAHLTSSHFPFMGRHGAQFSSGYVGHGCFP
jgi:hypothetical protein